MTLNPRLNPGVDPKKVRKERDLIKVDTLISFIEEQPELNLSGIAEVFRRTLQPDKKREIPNSTVYMELASYHRQMTHAFKHDDGNTFSNRQGVLNHLYEIKERAA
ncbi:hypothetical protein HOF78_01765 [Candidatus Woesearchaeota archaeon]|jgi:hypothetical protein|nr:hypothetical protein [Candidatus Woesearchaeota archaeon]